MSPSTMLRTGLVETCLPAGARALYLAILLFIYIKFKQALSFNEKRISAVSFYFITTSFFIIKLNLELITIK